MSQQQFESSVKLIPHNQSDVYAKLADLSNLSAIRERLDDPALQAQMGEQMTDEKMEKVREQLRTMQFDTDSVSVSVPPVGNVCLRIIEREEPKCVKFVAEGSPLPLNLWIQLVPADEGQCKMRLTVRADINPFIKMMVSKPLQDGVEKLADMLAMLPYDGAPQIEPNENDDNEDFVV